ncbi:hypothetical protein LWM68_42115 [Niabella sp. W65]|nr:hypothetical protein [Niabella sp. W65]MCH7368747.1 hypothetical protein [Niabella sp. W65]ULT44320.1 hypothetical protein KRR40_13800 [Niabella sp. I65]
MEERLKARLKRTTVKFWILLFYIIAALVWWFISLERQSREMYNYQLNHLNTTIDKEKDPVQYQAELKKTKEDYHSNTIKYGEKVLYFWALLYWVPLLFTGLCDSKSKYRSSSKTS